MPTLLSFALDVVTEFVVGADLARVGLVQFNGDADVLLPLSANLSAIEAALNGASPPQGWTSISKGIDKAVSLLGAARTGVAVTMLVLTDGVQTVDGGDSAAIAAAASAKAVGVQVFAVGFGSADVSTLSSMASAPASTHAYFGATIEDVRAHFASNGLCGLAASPLSPPPSMPAPSPAVPSPLPPGLPPASPSPPRAPTCAVPMELLLVLDRSGR